MVGRIKWQSGILGVYILFTGALGCGDSGTSVEEAKAERPERFANVITTEVSTNSFTSYLDLVGEIEPQQRVTVSIEEIGIVDRILVEKGQRVKAGQIIARLKDDILTASANEARASLKLSELNLSSQKKLFDEQAASETAYLEAQYQHDMAEARYDLAYARLNKMVIRAPIRGLVDTRELEVGELATATRSFMDIVDIDRVKVVAGVPERHLRHVQLNTSVSIAFPAYPAMNREGQISFMGTTIDPDNRTISIEIDLTNADHKLKPEMAATIRVVKDYIPEAIVIPQDAVVDTDQGMMVFIADGQVARSVPVKLGPLSQDKVVVTEGLQRGMALITVGHRDLVDGELIRVRSE